MIPAAWLEKVASQFRSNPSRLNLCDAGHDGHESTVRDIVLEGASAIPDYPAIPKWLRTEFTVVHYDWAKYSGTPMYCSGNDDVSQTIDVHGIWEGFETLLALEILNQEGDGIMVDLGSHVGWYSLMAASIGRSVLAVDADRENLDLLERAAELSGTRGLIITAHGWIDDKTPVLESGPVVRLLKADVEGAEDQVLRVCRNLFVDRLVEYAFFEVSPEFSSHYADTVQSILDCGYSVHAIPNKGTSIEAFASDPLGFTLNSSLDRSDIVNLRSQINVVFVLGDT